MAIKAEPHPTRSPSLRFSSLPLSRRSAPPRGAAAIALVACAVLATWIASGVAVADVARFVAFEGLYVCLPGCMLYALLARRPGDWLRVLAIGWPLGCAIEIGAFALAAALDARALFALLPLVALAILGPCLAHARRRSPACMPSPGAASASTETPGLDADRGRARLLGGVLVSLAVLVLALRFFAPYPLPGHARSASYLPDNVYAISLAAEARHHWPITQSYVAGQPLRFYTGLFIHVAAVSQVTGVAPATVVLRLLPSSIVLIVALQLWLLCRELGGSPWTGPLAIALFLLFGELGLDATRFETFGVSFFDTLAEAPTNALGVPFMLALLALLQRALAVGGRGGDAALSPRPGRARAAPLGSLALFAVLALGASTVKTETVADLLGGIALLLLLAPLARRRAATRAAARPLLAYGAISLVAIAIVYYAMLAGGVSSLRIEPFSFVPDTVFAPLFPAHSPVRFVLLAAAALFSCLLLSAPLLGALWLLRRRGEGSPFIALCAAVFAVALGAYLVLAAPRDSGLDFLIYGYVAIVPAAALGLTRLWGELPAIARAGLAWGCVAVLLLGLAVAGSSELLTDRGVLTRASLIPGGEALLGARHLAWAAWYLAAYALVAGAIVLAGLGLERRLAAAMRSRPRRVLACCLPLLVTLGLVKSLGVAGPELWKTIVHGRATVKDTREDQGISAQLYSGLLWVRDHTASCDVLAVNNHYLKAPASDSRYFYYSAFAERRVFLESWAYPARWPGEPQPFPARLALNTLAVSHGDPVALRELARMGVSFVLVDKTHGGGAPEPASVSRLVFSNPALDVYELTDGVGARRARACASGVSA